MITLMISGAIAKPPEQRTAKNGSNYTLASIRVQEGEDAVFASLTAFGSLADTLAGLAKGDPVTVIGHGRVTTYQGKDGDTRAGLSITASRIITLADHQAPPRAGRSGNQGVRRHRTPAPAEPPGPRQDLPPVPPVPPIEAYDDPIPF